MKTIRRMFRPAAFLTAVTAVLVTCTARRTQVAEGAH